MERHILREGTPSCLISSFGSEGVPMLAPTCKPYRQRHLRCLWLAAYPWIDSRFSGLCLNLIPWFAYHVASFRLHTCSTGLSGCTAIPLFTNHNVTACQSTRGHLEWTKNLCHMLYYIGILVTWILNFDIVAGVLQGDTLAPYLFIICLDYVLRTSIDKIRENGFELTKRRSRRYPAKTITDADYADDLALLANTPNLAETLLHSLERAAAGIGLHVNANKTEYMCYNQTGNIATLDGASLKLVDKFTYLGSSVSSTEKDIDTRLTKAWTAIDRLSIIWKSDLTDKMKRSFFQAAVVSILLYGCTTWTLTKRLERKLDGNYTRMLRALLNKSRRQHPTRLQLYGHLPPITKTIQVRRTRHAGHCWRSKNELISDVLLWTPTYGCAKVGQPARTYIQQLCEDTGCNPEDLPEAMNDREKWRERVRDIRAGGATWWWWWFGILKSKFIKDFSLYVWLTFFR